jgi:hypothetical protein
MQLTSGLTVITAIPMTACLAACRIVRSFFRIRVLVVAAAIIAVRIDPNAAW